MNNQDAINKFIEFANSANSDLFILIFGKDRGNRFYHNDFFCHSQKNMTHFISNLSETDRKIILNYFHETFCSQ